MANLKRSRGKWRVFRIPSKNSDGRYQTSIVSNVIVDNPICCIWGKTKEQCESNAKLISMAPELLEMLINIKDYLGSVKRAEVETLIKKAT